MPVVLFALQATAGGAGQAPVPSADVYRRLADEADANLTEHVLDKWFPAAIDRDAGGFYEDFNADWSRGAGGEKTVVCQARLTWLAAQAASNFPDKADGYRSIARHGVRTLAEKLWDAEHGGFFWAVDAAGRPSTPIGGEKHAYGSAFAVYGLAAAHAATGDADALDLAKRAFRWLDGHAHDDANGGYFEALTVDGTPILEPRAGGGDVDAIGTRYGRKSMNAHIHLLEAFVALHAVWPDPDVRARLVEVHDVILKRFYVEPGVLRLYVTPDWQPVPGHVDSYGHDVETAFLLAESAAALGKPDEPATWHAARRLVDHALDVATDREHGGLFYEGTADGRDLDTKKVWWVQAECLNALLLMHERYGGGTPRYWDAFVRQWAFISAHQVDAAHGGWHAAVNADGSPVPGRPPKGDRWTEGYHQGRALMTVAARLRRLSGTTKGKSVSGD
jgi:cellobiose epimerase